MVFIIGIIIYLDLLDIIIITFNDRFINHLWDRPAQVGKWRHVTEEELRALRAVVDTGEAQTAGQREKTKKKTNTAHDEGEVNESEHEGTDSDDDDYDDNDDDGDEEDLGDDDNDDGDRDLAKLWEAEHAAEESPIKQQPEPEGEERADVK